MPSENQPRSPLFVTAVGSSEKSLASSSNLEGFLFMTLNKLSARALASSFVRVSVLLKAP